MANVNIAAGIRAGLVAGLVFIILEMLLVGTVGGQSPWGPPRMIAAIAMGEGVLPPPATFDVTVMIVALLVHFALSAVLGAVFAVIAGLLRLNPATSAIVGLLFGLAIYLIHFYGMTALFPWFAMARNTISVIAHGVFGLVLGWCYGRWAAPRAAAV